MTKKKKSNDDKKVCSHVVFDFTAIGYVSSEPEGSCPSGYVKQGGLNGAPGDNKICGKHCSLYSFYIILTA